MQQTRSTLIVGAAGRDFHIFNTVYRTDSHHRVLGFTSPLLAADETSLYPACLSGELYPDGIPILPESRLEEIIAELDIKDVVFAYSELPEISVRHLAARVLAAGADFQLLSPYRSMLSSNRPVIAVTAARSGAGKTPTVRWLAHLLHAEGRRVAVIRHPVPHQTFDDHIAHRVATAGDLVADECNLAERTEFEPLFADQVVVYSGLDYAQILAEAQEEADVILWDGGGNDLPFLRPDLHIVVTDPLRFDDEVDYFPGEVCLRMADLIIINKCDSASVEQIELVESRISRVNPDALVLTADSPVTVEGIEQIRGRTVTIVEEGLSLTLGALKAGAGMVAARQAGVSGIISPRANAVGSLVKVYREHPEAQSILPVMGYSPQQVADLQATLDATHSEAVIDATRLDLRTILTVTKPMVRAAYELRPHDPEALAAEVRKVLA